MFQPICTMCVPPVPPPPSWNLMVDELAADRAFVRDPLPASWNCYEQEFPVEQEIRVLETPSRLVDSRSFDVKLMGKICGYLSLEEGWDGEGAVPISAEAVEDCLDFLRTIPVDAGAPKAMPLPGGEISLYWDRDSTYAEITFDGSHSFCAYAKGPGVEPIYIDRSKIGSGGNIGSFPKSIRALLAASVPDLP